MNPSKQYFFVLLKCLKEAYVTEMLDLKLKSVLTNKYKLALPYLLS